MKVESNPVIANPQQIDTKVPNQKIVTENAHSFIKHRTDFKLLKRIIKITPLRNINYCQQ